MASFKHLEARADDRSTQKWSISLGEEEFKKFASEGTSAMAKEVSAGSLFSPLLFGKYFDPSDAFPLWEFESEVLLANQGRSNVDWYQIHDSYILKADLQGEKEEPRVFVDDGKIVEISGQWRVDGDQEGGREWRNGRWWEYGYVRRLELPEDAEGKKIQATIINGRCLEIRIPKITLPGNA